MSRLVFSKARHTYSLDGKHVPSVTGIIGKATGKPGLIKWAARLSAEWAAAHVEELGPLGPESWVARAASASDRARDEAAGKGTQLHELAARLVEGYPVEMTNHETGEVYDPDVVRMAEQAARFMDAWDVSADTALIECPVFHEELLYAGRWDLAAVLRGGERWLIDYKTGATGVWPETSYQLCAYKRATHVVVGDRDMINPPIQRTAALWIRPDSWELLPVRTDALVWDAFAHMLSVAEVVSMPRSEMIGAPLPVPEVA